MTTLSQKSGSEIRPQKESRITRAVLGDHGLKNKIIFREQEPMSRDGPADSSTATEADRPFRRTGRMWRIRSCGLAAGPAALAGRTRHPSGDYIPGTSAGRRRALPPLPLALNDPSG